MELTYYYPFTVYCDITCDWKKKVEFPVGSGKFIVHSGQDTSNKKLHALGGRSKLSVFSMLDGVVRQVKAWGRNGSLGMGVQVYYPQINVMNLKLHLAEVSVNVGDRVKAGQVLGYVGVAKNQTIAEHTHDQYELGDILSTGVMGKNTQNPYNYTKLMKLKSDIEKPKPPMEVSPADPTVVIPESVYQALLQKQLDDLKAIAALNSLISMKNAEIDSLNQTVMENQKVKNILFEDIGKISSLLGVKYTQSDEWDIQKYKYNGAIANIRTNALAESSVSELLKVAINKFFGQKND